MNTCVLFKGAHKNNLNRLVINNGEKILVGGGGCYNCYIILGVVSRNVI